MRARLAWLTGAALAMALAQDGEAPPAIAQGGISNWASHMPMQLAAGGLAPGTLIRIRGWRLGGAPLEKIKVQIRGEKTTVEAKTLAASDGELEAMLPADTPLGKATLRVVKNGQASAEWPVEIAPASFGAFTRNGEGWGAGEIRYGGGSAQPGEIVTIAGTGLGSGARGTPPQILVAGHAASKVRILPESAARPGVDQIEFALPADAPEGCDVPVVVHSAPGIYSNTVTVPVNRRGGPCTESGWPVAAGNRALRLGTASLLHADLLIGPTATQGVDYPVDAGFASFASIEPGASANPLFLFPPRETCTSYSGTAGLHSVTSPLAALEALPGAPIDLGAAITVSGAAGEKILPRDRTPRGNYWAVIGGQSPVPGAKAMPLFLSPGEYKLHTDAFDLGMRMRPALVWQNRQQIAEVDRAQGVNVEWTSSGATKTMVLIVAMNVDARSGATGICACLANAADGNFRIPAYALANIPPTPEHPRGFPLNLLLLVELPERPDTAPAKSLDRLLAFTASVSGRVVQYR